MLTQSTEGFRISPIQHRLWKLTGMQAGDEYRVRGAVRLDGALDAAILQRAIEAALARHEALRTSLLLLPGVSVPVQVVANDTDSSLQVTLTQTGENCHQLEISGPAVCLDFKSLEIVIEEIARAYHDLRAGRTPESGEVPQYPDISEWLNELAEDQDASSGRKYWRQVGAEVAGGLAPIRRDGSTVEELRVNLDGDTAKKILAAGESNVQEFLLAAWIVLLKKLGAETNCVAVACDGRADETLSGAVGPLTRYLPVMIEAGQQTALSNLAAEAALALEKAANWQNYFTWDVFAGDTSEHKSSHFDFCFDHVRLTKLQTSEPVSFEIEQVSGSIDGFGMRLSSEQSDTGLRLTLTWLSHLHTRQEAVRIADGLAALLSDAMENPQESIRDLAILNRHAQQRLLDENQRTFADFIGHALIHEQFATQAAKTPNAVAVMYEDQKLTYSELNDRANCVAHHLRAQGVGPESLVGILLDRSLEMVVGLLAVLKAGGAYVPLDPGYPVDRLEYMLASSKATIVLTSTPTSGKFAGLTTEVANIEDLQSAVVASPDSQVREENPAYVIFTSGSTGQPKGVVITHGAIRNHMAWMQREFPLGPSDRILQKTAFSFDASVWEFYAPLLAGGVLVMARPGGQADGEYLVTAAKEQAITVLQLVPAQLRMLLEQPNLEECRSLKRVYCGGEALGEDLVQAFYQRLPGARLFNLYGPTEATIDATYCECHPGRESGTAPIGKPVANTQAYVLDEEMKLAPVGVKGELYIGGAGLARGYLNRPELTADRFVPNPFGQAGGERLYRTGDQVKWLDDGMLEFFGRLDHQVKLRGFRIELGEIEAALKAAPQVQQTIVMVREDVPGDAQLVAYVVGEAVDESELRSHLKQRLPEYMTPGAFVMLDKFPMTPNGKVDRKSLPAPERVGQAGEYAAPRGAEEEILCGIFAEVLKRDRVGRHDSFFELGGHSLVATQVISRLRNAFGIELPLRALFESPTVAGLAQQVRDARAETQRLAPAALQKVSREQDLPLSFAQQRLWFLDQLEPANAAYNMSFGLRLKGALDKNALRRSLNEIVRRHEVLRTRLPERDGVAVQEIVAFAPVKIMEIDLRRWPAAEREERTKKLHRAEAEKPFDLQAGPLLRAKLVQVDEQEHALLLTLHHIVSDGWSVGVMVRELTQLYEAYHKGQASPLAEIELQYADYAVWQRRWLQGEVLEQQMEYWRKQLAGAPALEMPTDRPRPAVASYAGDIRQITLNQHLTKELRELSRREGVTLFMTLLAAFQVLLARYTGQWDVSVGTDVANRNREETENLIGFFVNTLVLRTELNQQHSFRDVLKQVREVTLGAYAHQDLPFEKLVEELAPERNLGLNPLFQVLFTMQNTPDSELRLGDLQLSAEVASTGLAKFDLNLLVAEQDQQLSVALEYGRDLFEAETIERMLAHWETLLKGLAADPERHISELPLISQAEWQRIGVNWNQTEAAYPREFRVQQLFEQQVKCTPNAVAAVHAGRQITYAELNRQANQAARYLQKQGVGRDVVVALLMERGTELLTAILSVFKAGGAYLPLDPNHPNARHTQILKQGGVTHLISTRDLAQGLEADLKVFYAEDLAMLTEPDGNLLAQNQPGDLAYVIYTSGSTGVSKGAMVEHAGMLNHLYAKVNDLQLDANDRVAQNASQSFDISVWQFLAALVAGGRVDVVSNELAVDPQQLLAYVAAQKITVLEIVPSLLRAILEEIDHGRMAAPELPELRWLLLTGEALPPELVRRWVERYPATPMLNAYGPTECSDDVTHHVIRIPESLNSAYTPIGRPIMNTRLYVLDSSLQPAPTGVPGELYVAGVAVGRGYINDPVRTAQVMLPDPFSSDGGARLYRTGDLVRLTSAGDLIFLGRTDHQVKLRGYRIELGEIEAALDRDERVQQTVVTVHEDESGNKRLVAYVIARQEVTGAELRDALKQQLPDYMAPSIFVMLDRFPLTPNGKVDRRALPEPTIDRASQSQSYIAPRTPTEEAVAAIWAEVLKVDRVGAEDNFFELGGHSLLATQVMSRVRNVLEIDVPLRALFEGPTVAGLAQIIEQQKAGAGNPSASTEIQKELSMEQMLAGLENISEEEVELLLAMEDTPQ